MSHTCEFTAETVLDELEGALDEDDFDLEPLSERIEQVLGAHLRAGGHEGATDDVVAVRSVLQQSGVHDAFESEAAFGKFIAGLVRATAEHEEWINGGMQ